MCNAERKTLKAEIERSKSKIAVDKKKLDISFCLGLFTAKRVTQNAKVMLQAVRSALIYSGSIDISE